MYNIQGVFSIFEFVPSIHFLRDVLHKIEVDLFSFVFARYLTVSPRGPVLTLRRGRQPELMSNSLTLRKKTLMLLRDVQNYLIEKN